jgi:uncharacterized Ntn-hydrolase superfamily protein
MVTFSSICLDFAPEGHSRERAVELTLSADYSGSDLTVTVHDELGEAITLTSRSQVLALIKALEYASRHHAAKQEAA